MQSETPRSKPVIDWDCVAYNLKDHMETEGLSLRALQKRTGVDKSTLLRICAGKRCTPEAYLAVCFTMGAKPMYFFENEATQMAETPALPAPSAPEVTG
jgi:lambda repressor-like predicted transcriptional regulator